MGRKPDRNLLDIFPEDWLPLSCSCDIPTPIKPLTEEQKKKVESSLDGISALGIPRPKDKEEEEKLVGRFLEGLKKLLSREDNWTFWQPLIHSLESCVRCQTCSDACPVYVSSGKQEIYRPTYRGEVLRRIINKYLKIGGKALAKIKGEDIELNWVTVSRIAELAYRCTLCRRCAQWCPLGSDNGLIAREIRKLFSQEMGIAPREIHESGTVQHLKLGASTGMIPKAFENLVQFMEDEIEDRTGKRINVPVDKEGADILLLHNSGEYLTWMENPAAFAILFEAAGLNWTLSSDLYGYEATNYGVWYDDIQFARIVLKQVEVARKLKVKKIVAGECGHAHKELVVIADRILIGDMNFPRESFLPLLADLIRSGRLKLDPAKNDFPVTLHDPCNVVRLMGIVEPQRQILKKACLRFREMEPHGVENYCCGGGSGFAIMSNMNFPDWRVHISGRMKLKQILDVFRDILDPEIKKYVCAPCSNCKGQIRDLLGRYRIGEKHNIRYGGLVELVANAMVDLEKPFIEWET
ncbi:MAG: (Fe-S)-binding protein [Deltaproteobacteria bacterium]|nr:MAG: (Fe-S)-binding protein [Deltaproteobacteria bacterium]